MHNKYVHNTKKNKFGCGSVKATIASTAWRSQNASIAVIVIIVAIAAAAAAV